MSDRPRVTALVLAAGASSRMQGAHKLLEEVAGRAVVRWVVDAAASSAVDDVSVVVGHRADDVMRTLPDGIATVENADFMAGLSSSLRAGVGALGDHVDGVLVLLGDMPFVSVVTCDALIDAFEPGRVCVPVVEGKRGNPVLWSRAFFDEIKDVRGDRGARELLARHPDLVTEVDVADEGALFDIDDVADLARARAPSSESTTRSG